MDETDLEALVQAGELLFLFKVFLTSMHWLWVYDYFLTLGDELTYAWSGRKSWIFLLFIANRYTPLLYLTWVNVALFDYTESLCVSTSSTHFSYAIDPHPLDSCQKTKWISLFHTIAVTVLAQLAVALRIYAVTRRNVLLGSLLLVLISIQLCFGIYFITRTGMTPAQPLPEIKLDAFEVCIYNRWKLGELLFTNMVIGFDFLAFSIISVTARRSRAISHPGIPSILDAVFRGATLYFTFISVCQVLLELFLLFAPKEIQLMPGVANIVFVPVMASRLMLSLKKAAVEPTRPWSIETMSDSGRATHINFASRVLGASHETLETLPFPNEEGVELDSMPRAPRNCG